MFLDYYSVRNWVLSVVFIMVTMLIHLGKSTETAVVEEL